MSNECRDWVSRVLEPGPYQVSPRSRHTSSALFHYEDDDSSSVPRVGVARHKGCGVSQKNANYVIDALVL